MAQRVKNDAIPSEIGSFFDKYSPVMRVLLERRQADKDRTPRDRVRTKKNAKL